MNRMKAARLIMFLGTPGAGKSAFARQLAVRLNAVRLNGDAMRFALYGSVDGINYARHTLGRDEVNRQTFSALNYASDQILSRGHSVVYDARRNRRAEREALEVIARQHGAVPLIVWVKAPENVAFERTKQRDQMPDQPKYSDEELELVMERHVANFEQPIKGEHVIEIDGTMPFELQYESFLKQL